MITQRLFSRIGQVVYIITAAVVVVAAVQAKREREREKTTSFAIKRERSDTCADTGECAVRARERCEPYREP